MNIFNIDLIKKFFFLQIFQQDLKHAIIDEALTVIASHVIIPCSGWEGGEVEREPNNDVWWSTVFKNASGVLRFVLMITFR